MEIGFSFKLERKISFDDKSGVLVMFLWVWVQGLGNADLEGRSLAVDQASSCFTFSQFSAESKVKIPQCNPEIGLLFCSLVFYGLSNLRDNSIGYLPFLLLYTTIDIRSF
jgi:hypothetical protein